MKLPPVEKMSLERIAFGSLVNGAPKYCHQVDQWNELHRLN